MWQTQSVWHVRTAHISVLLWTLCHTIQHTAVLIIFPPNLQTITITRMLSIGGEGGQDWRRSRLDWVTSMASSSCSCWLFSKWRGVYTVLYQPIILTDIACVPRVTRWCTERGYDRNAKARLSVVFIVQSLSSRVGRQCRVWGQGTRPLSTWLL